MASFRKIATSNVVRATIRGIARAIVSSLPGAGPALGEFAFGAIDQATILQLQDQYAELSATVRALLAKTTPEKFVEVVFEQAAAKQLVEYLAALNSAQFRNALRVLQQLSQFDERDLADTRNASEPSNMIDGLRTNESIIRTIQLRWIEDELSARTVSELLAVARSILFECKAGELLHCTGGKRTLCIEPGIIRSYIKFGNWHHEMSQDAFGFYFVTRSRDKPFTVSAYHATELRLIAESALQDSFAKWESPTDYEDFFRASNEIERLGWLFSQVIVPFKFDHHTERVSDNLKGELRKAILLALYSGEQHVRSFGRRIQPSKRWYTANAGAIAETCLANKLRRDNQDGLTSFITMSKVLLELQDRELKGVRLNTIQGVYGPALNAFYSKNQRTHRIGDLLPVAMVIMNARRLLLEAIKMPKAFKSHSAEIREIRGVIDFAAKRLVSFHEDVSNVLETERQRQLHVSWIDLLDAGAARLDAVSSQVASWLDVWNKISSEREMLSLHERSWH